MNRVHCKMVVNVAQFGAGEEEVYNNLRQKKEEIWRGTYSRSLPPSRNGQQRD
jgi:hypothetical protein